ncbi:MAG: winged helix-turn-helix domain-containing protein [Candidatus Izemoplasmataceae bacterium]
MMKINSVPVFEQIAYELACKIKNNELTHNQKIRGRSIIASEFSVSSETVRKALAILEKNGVVDIKEQSGAYVKSKAEAVKYIAMHHQNVETEKRFEEIDLLLKESMTLQKTLQTQFKQIKKNNDVHKSVLPINTFSIKVKQYDAFLYDDFSIDEFEHIVGGNIFGVVRKDAIISGIKREFNFLLNDEVFISGGESVKQKTLSFIKNPDLLK